MDSNIDYRIKKNEKGPLERFKNQNVLLKRFGDVGLQVYKAITGKRTVQELKKDLNLDTALFDQIIKFMSSSKLISLEPTDIEKIKDSSPEVPSASGFESAQEVYPLPQEEPLPAEKEIPFEKKKKQQKQPKLQEKESIEIEPIEINPLETTEETRPEEQAEEAQAEQEMQEISPVDIELEKEEPTPPSLKRKKSEDKIEEVTSQEIPQEIKAEEQQSMEFEQLPPINSYSDEDNLSASGSDASSDLSPVEKIISDKYGPTGLKVYSLIDGQRTAEEIMQETGLTESKLVEILDFLDAQGIIKLDYPKNQPPPPPPSLSPFTSGSSYPSPPPYQQKPQQPVPSSDTPGFVPMIEGEESLEESAPVPSPLEVPAKAPMDIVHSVQMKAKILLRYGDKAGKLSDLIDGKKDVIDISLSLDLPLYVVREMLQEMLENGMIIMTQVPRPEVRKKYGDDGYAVYKRYGKEGLMLYELIGRELSMKQMAQKITKDRTKIVDIFVFIHEVLAIELPIDRERLASELKED